MTTLQELFTLCNSSPKIFATQADLDEIGLLLDRLEELEIFMDSSCSSADLKDSKAEFGSILDRLDALVAIV